MARYIELDPLVAEIERRIKTNKECMFGLKNLDYYQGKVDALNDTISSINTFTKVNNNLFKEVYFGKPYKTRDGRKALYCYKFTDNSHALIVEGDEEFWYVRDDGLVDDFDDSFMDSSYYTDKDIVSEW